MILIDEFSCLIVDVIRETLASCDYNDCSDVCFQYLLEVGSECQVVFHNLRYEELWSSLIHICLDQGEKISH
jgi:hypothetical protein